MGLERKKLIGPLFASALVAAGVAKADSGKDPVVCTPEHPMVVGKDSVPMDLYPPFPEETRVIAKRQFERFIGCQDNWVAGSDDVANKQAIAIMKGDVQVAGQPHHPKVKGNPLNPQLW